MRYDILELIAANRIVELSAHMAENEALARIIEPIIAARLNLTDRML